MNHPASGGVLAGLPGFPGDCVSWGIAPPPPRPQHPLPPGACEPCRWLGDGPPPLRLRTTSGCDGKTL